MSSNALLVPAPFQKGVGRGNTTLWHKFDGIYRALPLEVKYLWQAIFSDPEGFVPMWAMILLARPVVNWTRRIDHELYKEWNEYQLSPYFIEALNAGLKQDWTTFDSVLGMWELSEAKD